MTSLDSNGGQVQRDDDDHDVAQGDAGTTVVVVAGDGGGELGGGENWTLLSSTMCDFHDFGLTFFSIM